MTRKRKIMSIKSNSFVAAAEQVCLQPVLEHRQRRGRRNSCHMRGRLELAGHHTLIINERPRVRLVRQLERHNQKVIPVRCVVIRVRVRIITAKAMSKS